MRVLLVKHFGFVSSLHYPLLSSSLWGLELVLSLWCLFFIGNSVYLL